MYPAVPISPYYGHYYSPWAQQRQSYTPWQTIAKPVQQTRPLTAQPLPAKGPVALPVPSIPWYHNIPWVMTVGVLGILGVTAACLLGNWQKVTQKAQSWMGMFSNRKTQKDLMESGAQVLKTEFKDLHQTIGTPKGIQKLVDQVVTRVTQTLAPKVDAVTSLVTSDTQRQKIIQETTEAAVQAIEKRLPVALDASLKTVEDRYAQPGTWKGRFLRWVLGIKK